MIATEKQKHWEKVMPKDLGLVTRMLMEKVMPRVKVKDFHLQKAKGTLKG